MHESLQPGAGSRELATKLFHRIWARRLARRMPQRGRRFFAGLDLELELDVGVLRLQLGLGAVVDAVVFETAGARRTSDGKERHTRKAGLHTSDHPPIRRECVSFAHKSHVLHLSFCLSPSLALALSGQGLDKVVTESAFCSGRESAFCSGRESAFCSGRDRVGFLLLAWSKSKSRWGYGAMSHYQGRRTREW